jgi:hypothetical protein
MNCSEALALAQLSRPEIGNHEPGDVNLDVNLSDSDDLKAHLARCPSCAHFVAVEERLRAAALAETVDTEALERRVMQRVRLEGTRARHRMWNWALAGGFAAVAVAAVIGYQTGFTKSVPSPLFVDAAADHRTEVVDHQPRRWRMDVASAATLAGTRGINGSFISAVEKAGYGFKEARLCKLAGLVFLHLVYTDGGREFSVFLRQEDGGTMSGSWHSSASGKSIYTADSGPFHVAGFVDGALKAVVVCDEPGEALRVARATARVL